MCQGKFFEETDSALSAGLTDAASCYTIANMKDLVGLFILLPLLFAPVHADEQGVVVRLAPVHASASVSSDRIGQLSAGTRVSLFSREGGWQEIFSEDPALTGWVRIYQVRGGSYAAQPQVVEKAEDSRGFLAGLASFSRKASGYFTQDSGTTSSGTATIGVRGLSESEIKSAKADFEELEKMEKFASKTRRMGRFTSEGELQASQVPYISGFKE